MDNAKAYGRRMAFLAIAIALALLSASATFAFQGSGGSISSTISPGSVTMEANHTHMRGGASPAAAYVGGTLAGYLGIRQSQGSDVFPPTVTPQSPANLAVRTSRNVTFAFTATDASGLANCTLYIDAVPQGTLQGPANGANGLNATLDPGNHTWQVGCSDTQGNAGLSQGRNLKVVLASTFDADTTDLTTADISNIPNLIIAQSGNGKIDFGTATDLTGVYDLESHITIGVMSISLDSAQLPVLDKPATLTIYGVPYQHVLIWQDSAFCDTCSITSLIEGTLVFEVQGFSNYTITSNARLGIFDDSDLGISYGYIRFYANYTNRTSGLPVPGAGCDINFSDGSQAMAYNASSEMYEYARTLPAGVHFYNVTCSAAGYDAITLDDNAVIAVLNGPRAAEVEVTQTVRSNASIPVQGATAQGEFISDMSLNLMMDSVSWQGFYGQASAIFGLWDGDGATFFDWSATTPTGEIYATRSVALDFSSLRCAEAAEVLAEEAFMGLDAGSPEGVNSTFSRRDHPPFSAGTVVVGEDDCRSTNLFVNGSAQTAQFYELLLADVSQSMVYTALLEQDQAGFDSEAYDFQMLVGVDGNTGTATYYFYAEME